MFFPLVFLSLVCPQESVYTPSPPFNATLQCNGLSTIATASFFFLFCVLFFFSFVFCIFFLFVLCLLRPRVPTCQLHMDTMGKFSNKTIKRHMFSYEKMEKLPHFSEDFRFRQQGIDKVGCRSDLFFFANHHRRRGRPNRRRPLVLRWPKCTDCRAPFPPLLALHSLLCFSFSLSLSLSVSAFCVVSVRCGQVTGKGVVRYVDVNPRPLAPLAKTLAKAKVKKKTI